MDKGTLYIVATPIGNLGDITLRALETLKTVHAILAEDTRHTHILLNHYGIVKPLFPYHDFNKEKVTSKYIDWLLAGQSLALVSDAGTPGISDPAFGLVREAARAHIPLVSLPGPCAFITGLVISGLPGHPHQFGGFIPKKKGAWLPLFKSCLLTVQQSWAERMSFSFYLSPHQIQSFLPFLNNTLGSTFTFTLARELTKKFEEVRSASANEWLSEYSQKTAKGEFICFFGLSKLEAGQYLSLPVFLEKEK